MTRRLVLVIALVLTGCGSQARVRHEQVAAVDPAAARAALALREVQADFAARWIPNRWGVAKQRIHIRGLTLEAWSTLPLTRAGMREAVGLCNRMYRRYVIAPAAHFGVGQAAVYSRTGVLLTASLRYRARCFALAKVRRS